MHLEIRPLIEKYKLKHIARSFSRKINGVYTKIPHLSLVYDFYTRKPDELMARARDVLKRTTEKDLEYGDIVLRRGMHGFVLAFSIGPENLRALRNRVYDRISELIDEGKEGRLFNKKDKMWLHATIVHRINRFSAFKLAVSGGQVRSGLSMLFDSKTTLIVRNYRLSSWVQRVTLLNNARRIVYEYDLYLDRILPRKNALSRRVYSASLKALRLKEQLEVPEDRQRDDIYLVSDLHLGHRNIIKYCARPFSSTSEMDKVLTNNWNRTVAEDSEVYFLGDLSTSRSYSEYWIEKLNGKITFIRGNHDAHGEEKIVLHADEYDFLLVHDPEKYVGRFDGWIVHGHKHNNDMFNYPFINPETKTINVSVELTRYRPVSLTELVKYAKQAEKTGEKLLIRPKTSIET